MGFSLFAKELDVGILVCPWTFLSLLVIAGLLAKWVRRCDGATPSSCPLEARLREWCRDFLCVSSCPMGSSSSPSSCWPSSAWSSAPGVTREGRCRKSKSRSLSTTAGTGFADEIEEDEDDDDEEEEGDEEAALAKGPSREVDRKITIAGAAETRNPAEVLQPLEGRCCKRRGVCGMNYR
uniref:Uncharacterized protein n=1 Tax=Compsopogon caeruleus TaxID=31354 RepID=A0A7S1XEV5_9RHOD|mmetsp:Transcript_18377/g.38441  ORF Transcript_18377/g.38441 Transcript_18377/m.38441 type:complete len:180 (+) Transcript_18377:298-837(+)